MPVLDEPELKTQIFVKPVMELRLLNIDFTYSDEKDLSTSHPSRYLEHMIRREGSSSAFAYLKGARSCGLFVRRGFCSMSRHSSHLY